MSQTMCVGNDIVDLGHRRVAGKSSVARFMERIFTKRERERILQAPEPDLELWTAWAAKEAAFKVVTKITGSRPLFRHAAFETVRRGGIGPNAGAVHNGQFVVPFSADSTSRWIHVTAWSPGYGAESIRTGISTLDSPGPPSRSRTETFDDWVHARFTSRERQSIRRPASAHVRWFARTAIADHLGVDDARLEIVCPDGPVGRMPPSVLMDGSDAGFDVSLSHHGPFLAWAFAAQLH